MSDDFSLVSLEDPLLATVKMKRKCFVFCILTAIGITAGVYASMLGHHRAFSLSREVPWGILISSYSYLMVIATGLCLLAATSFVAKNSSISPMGNRAIFLSIVTICSGFMLISFDIESPWRMVVFNMTSQNISSNIWWMTTLYGIAAGCLLLALVAMATEQRGLAMKLLIVGSINVVGATTNLSAAFTAAADPSIWYGLQLPVIFLISAILSGAAATVFFTCVAYDLRGMELDSEMLKAIISAGKIMRMMLFLIIVVSVWRFITIFGSVDDPGNKAALALVSGPLSVNFWLFETILGLVVPLSLLVISQLKSIRTIMIASVMVLVGSFFHRYDLVIVGQIVPKYSGWNNSLELLSYTPSIVELLIVMGALSLTGAGFLLGERFLGRAFRKKTSFLYNR